MFAAPPVHPLSETVFLALALLAVVALVGAVAARRWRGPVALGVRALTGVLAVGVPGAFEILAPAGGIEGAARLLTLWPLAALALLLVAVWAFRARGGGPPA